MMWRKFPSSRTTLFPQRSTPGISEKSRGGGCSKCGLSGPLGRIPLGSTGAGTHREDGDQTRSRASQMNGGY